MFNEKESSETNAWWWQELSICLVYTASEAKKCCVVNRTNNVYKKLQDAIWPWQEAKDTIYQERFKLFKGAISSVSEPRKGL